MGRAPCCDKANVKRGPWSPEEDATLKSYIEQNGTGGNWIALPQKIGLKRCGKSCRLRWLNYLRPNIKHGGFSEEEDNIICSLYISIGSRWSIIASRLEGRTDNDIKNYWNTKLKKKLLGKQRKDQQQGRRRAACREKLQLQEGKAVDQGDGGCSRSTGGYWVDPPVPIYPISKKEPIVVVDDGQASIRKLLLIKLGGRFSGDVEASPTVNPFAVPQAQPALYDESSTMAPPTDPSSFMDCLQDPAGFPTELGEMFRCNSLKLDGFGLGLDCLYGADDNDGSGNYRPSSSNWSEVSPLIYPPPLSGYQGMDQCLLEYPVHLEMQ